VYSLGFQPGMRHRIVIVPFLQFTIPIAETVTNLKKADNVYKKTGVIFNFKIFWPKYAKIRHFS